MRTVAVVFFLILNCSLTVRGQETDFGVSLGGSLYTGDLDASSVLESVTKHTCFAYGGFFRFNFSDRISLRTNLLVGQLTGDDVNSDKPWQIIRNLRFKTRILEIANLLEFNLFNINGGRGSRNWTPFVNGGIAFLNFNPTTVYEGVKYDLQNLGTEGQGLAGFDPKYNLNVFTIPVGFGLKFNLTDKLTLQIEMIGRMTFTDYLDDVSTNYVSVEDLQLAGRNIAAELAYRGDEIDPSIPSPLTGVQRGTPDVKDYYGTTMVSVYFDLEGLGDRQGKIKCPKFD